MRKINKSKILSSNYSEWLDKKRTANTKHKTCSYYKTDAVMSLLFCQKGVCAYTEMLLCAPSLIKKENWNTEKYINQKVNIDTFGHLEHFDPKLKFDYYCEWNNFFVIHEKVNVVKNDKDIELLKEFKPDNSGYNPDEIFDYDIITHKFRPNSDIADEEQITKIKKLIDVFLINQKTIKYERETFLSDVKHNKSKKIDRFFTAYEMAKAYL